MKRKNINLPAVLEIWEKTKKNLFMTKWGNS